MKNLKIYIIGFLIVGLSGCSELESINYDEINPNIFPQSEADIEALVAAAYYPLR